MSPRMPSVSSTAPVPPGTAVDPSARAVGMLGFRAAGMRVVRRWIEQVPGGTPVTWAAAQRADAVSLAELERLVSSAHVGWRLMLAGPEADVRAAREAALRLGMLDAEVRCEITAQQRDVQCPHCSAATLTDVAPGEQVSCSGCTVPLRVPVSAGQSRGTSVGVVDGLPAHHVA